MDSLTPLTPIGGPTAIDPIDLGDGVRMSFQPIPAGCFLMGGRGEFSDEEPRHLVSISAPFYLGTFPVTQEQFAVWTCARGIDHANEFADRAQHPAGNMDWDEAMAFCAWLNARPGIPEGYIATLPTEAEWEYACRATKTRAADGTEHIVLTETEYHTGDGADALDQAGWYSDNAEGQTHAVGERAANGYGLHDMHGNVDEWCFDAWDEDAYKKRMDGVVDPGASERHEWLLRAGVADADDAHNPDRVVRGGSWYGSAGGCRAAARSGEGPGYRDWLLGFRVCLVPGPVSAESGGAERRRSRRGETERGGPPRRSRRTRAEPE